jgi:hypothetical protein
MRFLALPSPHERRGSASDRTVAVFSEGPLGLTAKACEEGQLRACVASFVSAADGSAGQAERARVRPGDFIAAIEGRSLAYVSFDDVIKTIKAARRPMRVLFVRSNP